MTKVTVKGRDYRYEGWIVSAFVKRSGEQRFVVEDDCGRLFIHNADQITPKPNTQEDRSC